MADDNDVPNDAPKPCNLVALRGAEIPVEDIKNLDSVGMDTPEQTIGGKASAIEIQRNHMTEVSAIDSPGDLAIASITRSRVVNLDTDAYSTLDHQLLNSKSFVLPASSPHDNMNAFSDNKVCSTMQFTEDMPSASEANNDATEKESICKAENGANSETEQDLPGSKLDAPSEHVAGNQSFQIVEYSATEGNESGSDDEQIAFRKDVENFYRSSGLEFKAPKFYKEELNLLKLWKAVIKLGGYEQVTSCKLWRQVGESFRPPKTCTTVSWTFRIFYEKSLLEYEKHKLRRGELPFDVQLPDSVKSDNQISKQANPQLPVGNQAHVSGRARRDAAARAMQGWHSQRVLDNGEICHPVIKEKTIHSAPKHEKQLKTNGAGLLKRKNPLGDENAIHVTPSKTMKSQTEALVLDIASPAEWVKINVQKTIDCYEIYALVPGLLREEVHVQSDPAGRVVISGQPEELDNPWGILPFKKVVSLPTRIDPHHTSAVVTLHGQLFVRVPFEATT